MRIILPLVFICFLLLILISAPGCEKETLTPDQPDSSSTDTSVVIQTNTVYTGIIDSSFTVQNFNPPLTIPVTWDSTYWIGTGQIDLDLDGDSTLDFSFQRRTWHVDSLNPLPWGGPMPYLRIIAYGSNKVALEGENYPIGLGGTQTAWFTACLRDSVRVDTLPNWEGKESDPENVWAMNYGTFTPSYGRWYYINDIRYLGIQVRGKMGWMKVDATDPEIIGIMGYAYAP